MRIVYRFLFLSVLLIFVTNCARTGRPEGGPKDEDAPLFITAKPPYESVNFNKKEIKIVGRWFDSNKRNRNDQVLAAMVERLF